MGLGPDVQRSPTTAARGSTDLVAHVAVHHTSPWGEIQPYRSFLRASTKSVLWADSIKVILALLSAVRAATDTDSTSRDAGKTAAIQSLTAGLRLKPIKRSGNTLMCMMRASPLVSAAGGDSKSLRLTEGDR
jgi:hypothetical protein